MLQSTTAAATCENFRRHPEYVLPSSFEGHTDFTPSCHLHCISTPATTTLPHLPHFLRRVHSPFVPAFAPSFPEPCVRSPLVLGLRTFVPGLQTFAPGLHTFAPAFTRSFQSWKTTPTSLSLPRILSLHHLPLCTPAGFQPLPTGTTCPACICSRPLHLPKSTIMDSAQSLKDAFACVIRGHASEARQEEATKLCSMFYE